jgi:hypothetical protein
MPLLNNVLKKGIMKKKCVLIGFPLLLSVSLLFARVNSISIERIVDWEERVITFYLSTPVDQGGLPVSKQRSEGLITRLKTSVIAENLGNFPLDSWGPFTLDYPRSSTVSWNLQEATNRARKDYAVFTPDMKAIRVAYILPFSVITEAFQVASRQQLENSIIPQTEAFDYTGLVIYASVPLPVKDNLPNEAYLQPALLPSVFSERGLNLLTPATIERAGLRSWGTAAYSFSDDMRRWPRTRIGDKPFIVSGRGISGNDNVDVIISDKDAERLLANDKGRDILLKGKVLIIIKNPDDNAQIISRIENEASQVANATFSNM